VLKEAYLVCERRDGTRRLYRARPETVMDLRRFCGTEAELDPRPGGIYRSLMAGAYEARGEFVEVVPNERVVYTFGWDVEAISVPPGSTTVQIPLHPEGDKTRVQLVHRACPTMTP
jgi:uncharacterized protein YndB with AHSA1/START domain